MARSRTLSGFWKPAPVARAAHGARVGSSWLPCGCCSERWLVGALARASSTGSRSPPESSGWALPGSSRGRGVRLANAVGVWVKNQESTIQGEAATSEDVTIISQDGTPLGTNSRATPAEDTDAQRNYDAMMEETQLRDTWMPRVEAAQRAAVAAAGGTVNAPYLKDDLRITLVSAIATGVLIPIETLFAFIAFFCRALKARRTNICDTIAA